MVSVRIVGVFGVSLAAMTGGAQASSIVVHRRTDSTPSIVMLGSPNRRRQRSIKAGYDSSTPSIVVLGDPLPDVTDEKVAAIPDQSESKRGFMQSPMVIRGGIAGDAFATPAPPSAASATASAAAAPATDTEAAPTAVASERRAAARTGDAAARGDPRCRKADVSHGLTPIATGREWRRPGDFSLRPNACLNGSCDALVLIFSMSLSQNRCEIFRRHALARDLREVRDLVRSPRGYGPAAPAGWRARRDPHHSPAHARRMNRPVHATR